MIAIKDIEMPESCEACGAMEGHPFRRLICTFSYVNITSDKWDEERHESCPLVEIPDHVG